MTLLEKANCIQIPVLVWQEENVARISITHLPPVPKGPTRRFKLSSRLLPQDGTMELDRRAPTS